MVCDVTLIFRFEIQKQNSKQQKDLVFHIHRYEKLKIMKVSFKIISNIAFPPKRFFESQKMQDIIRKFIPEFFSTETFACKIDYLPQMKDFYKMSRNKLVILTPKTVGDYLKEDSNHDDSTYIAIPRDILVDVLSESGRNNKRFLLYYGHDFTNFLTQFKDTIDRAEEDNHNRGLKRIKKSWNLDLRNTFIIFDYDVPACLISENEYTDVDFFFMKGSVFKQFGFLFFWFKKQDL